MIAREEIHRMFLREKLITMEALWDDLSSDETQVAVPQWQKDLLDARDLLVREGKAHYVDWEVAKKEIQDSPASGRRIDTTLRIPSRDEG
jgi:hypothetical protein